jgi:hypothetical protein
MPNTQTADTLTDDTPIHVTEATSPHVYQQIALLVRWTLVGFGVGCLIGAAAIGAYTVFGATRLPDCRADSCAITTQLATRLGWVVLLVAAAILIALLGYRRLSDNVAVDRGLRLATAFAGLAVVIDYRTSQFARVRDEIDVYFRTWEQMWTVSAAVLLLAIGAWTVALFASRRLRRPSWFDAAGTIFTARS